MMDSGAHSPSAQSVESVLRAELANGDAVAATVSPILNHLLDSGSSALFADGVVASVRGMAADLARQLLDARRRASGQGEWAEHPADRLAELGSVLAGNAALVGHLHALALEWQLAQHLQARHALDPVLSPLVQSEMASSDPGTAALAMRFLAAQARFCQDQRRMQLPLTELPGDLLHGALIAMRTVTSQAEDGPAEQAEHVIRLACDEARSRLGLSGQLVAGLPSGGLAALSVGHAGSALFLTALSLGSRQDRDLAALATSESQLARLALALRACGLKQPAVEEQFLTLHPDVALLDGFDSVSPDSAAAMLAAASPFRGS